MDEAGGEPPRGSGPRAEFGPSLPAWPEACRQLAPCGPLVAVLDRRIKARG